MTPLQMAGLKSVVPPYFIGKSWFLVCCADEKAGCVVRPKLLIVALF
jgi:hypothetical protein